MQILYFARWTWWISVGIWWNVDELWWILMNFDELLMNSDEFWRILMKFWFKKFIKNSGIFDKLIHQFIIFGDELLFISNVASKWSSGRKSANLTVITVGLIPIATRSIRAGKPGLFKMTVYDERRGGGVILQTASQPAFFPENYAKYCKILNEFRENYFSTSTWRAR